MYAQADDIRIIPDDWTSPLQPAELYANPASLEVDVGCGKGRFLVARAGAHPEVNFLGIDRMLRRVRKVCGKVARAALTNVRLLRCESQYAIEYLLAPGSVSAFYVFFPDPWPKRRHRKRRMFKDQFINAIAAALTPGGLIHVATDQLDYFMDTHELFAEDPRFTELAPLVPTEEEQTDFERQFLAQGLQIGRCSFAKR